MRFLVRLFAYLLGRFKWLLVLAALRWLFRAFSDRRLNQATEEVASRMKENLANPINRAIETAPVDIARVGGRILLASRTTKNLGNASMKAGKLVATGSTKVNSLLDEFRSGLERTR